MTPAAARPELVVADGVAALVETAARRIHAIAATAVAERGRFRVALAGGSTPRALYPHLITDIDWTRADVFFGDERAVPPADPQSNYRMARETLLEPARVPETNVFRWRGEAADLDAAARDYEQALRSRRPAPPWLDLALLGLGPDGHTASLVPGDPVLDVTDVDVALTGLYQGRRRMTLTYPAINRARRVLWLVTGEDKAAMLVRLRRGDPAIPAGRVRQDHAIVLADRAAAQQLDEVSQ
jgi:6-phosphogluconolactonase